MADLKDAGEEIAQISKDIAGDRPETKKPQGLLSKPNIDEEDTDGN
jgi:hypothetical protein